MADYKCFTCGKNVDQAYVKRRVRCPYCGSKIVYKARTLPTHVVAR